MPPIADRRNAIATLAAIAETRPPLPEHGAFLIYPIGRMLDPDPASRWSMADAAHALRRLHEQHRPPGTLAMTGDVEPVPPAAPVLAAQRTQHDADRRGRPQRPARDVGTAPGTADVGTPPERDRRSRLPLLAGALLLLLLTGITGAVLLDRDGSDPSPSTGSDKATASPKKSAPPSTSADHVALAVPDRVTVLDRETADVGQRRRGAERGRLLRPAAREHPEGLGDAG